MKHQRSFTLAHSVFCFWLLTFTLQAHAVDPNPGFASREFLSRIRALVDAGDISDRTKLEQIFSIRFQNTRENEPVNFQGGFIGTGSTYLSATAAAPFDASLRPIYLRVVNLNARNVKRALFSAAIDKSICITEDDFKGVFGNTVMINRGPHPDQPLQFVYFNSGKNKAVRGLFAQCMSILFMDQNVDE